METDTQTIGPESTMEETLAAYPGARRALFRGYHIGGCASCGFEATETLAQLCERNNKLDVNEVLEHIRTATNRTKRSGWTPRPSPNYVRATRRRNSSMCGPARSSKPSRSPIPC